MTQITCKHCNNIEVPKRFGSYGENLKKAKSCFSCFFWLEYCESHKKR